jgi:hypothetical protein
MSSKKNSFGYGAEVAAILLFAAIFLYLSLLLGSMIFTAFGELNTGFSNFVDIVSKIATAATLIWSMYIFTHANLEKERSSEEAQIRTLISSLINYFQSPGFKLDEISVNVVQSYLYVIRTPRYESSKNIKEVQLVKKLLCQIFQQATLKEVLGIESKENTYHSVRKEIQRAYSDREALKSIDPTFLHEIENLPEINHSMRLPQGAIQKEQIIWVAAFILDVTEKKLTEDLQTNPGGSDLHHKFPVIFGVFCAYSNGFVFASTNEGIKYSETLLDGKR